jgi:hypothetical protein
MQRVVYLHDLAQWIEDLHPKATHPLSEAHLSNEDDRSSELLGAKPE